MVIQVDVGDHRDLRAQELERAVRFVALGDEPALARARIPAELRDLAADQERRIEASRSSTKAIIAVVVVLP